MARIGYGRVSTRDQNPDLQHDALTAAGCEKIFIDKASGKLARRPEWDRCLAYLRAGDELVITKLDRAGRSVRHLLGIAAELQEREIDLVVLQQGIDTTTPAGRLQFHVFAALAEFVGDLISEGTHEGLAAARARGRVGGRPTKLTARQLAAARKMLNDPELTLPTSPRPSVSRVPPSTGTSPQPTPRRAPRPRPDRTWYHGAMFPARLRPGGRRAGHRRPVVVAHLPASAVVPREQRPHIAGCEV